MSQIKKISDRILAIVLSFLMFLTALPMSSVSAMAASSSEISTDLESIEFKINDATEFTVTSTANEDVGKMVKGYFEFSDPSAIEKLEYYETYEGMQGWYELTGAFGPATGFPITDATSKFRVTFNKAGTYTVKIALKDVKTSETYCSIAKKVAVKDNSSIITSDIASKNFKINKATEFTVTSIANEDLGKMVKGYFEFSDPSAIEKLEYYETYEGMQGWYELTGEFGPATGFPISDATSKFRVTFNKVGSYAIDIALKDVSTSEIYCSTNIDLTVKSEPSVITSDIASKDFTVYQATEFSFTSTANDDVGRMVKGSFEFSDPSAIEKLEYYETYEGIQGWYELTGDFGPATGFPMTNGTSKFRVTFNKIGDYSVKVSMNEVDTGDVLCSVNADITVNKADIKNVSISPTLNKYNAGAEFSLAAINGLQPNDIVSYTIEGDPNVYAQIPKKSAVGKYKVTVKVDRGSNYNIFTQTVDSEIELGDLELGDIKIKGLESVYNGKAQDTVSVTGKGDYSLKYKLGDGEWSDTIPTIIDAGSYTVQVKATKTNYNDKDVSVEKAESAIYPFNVYIAKAEQTGFAFSNATPDDLAFNSSITYTPEGGQSDGAITYEVVAGNEYVSVDSSTGEIKAIKANGVATIKATKAENKNYKKTSATYNITTVKADQSDFNFEKSSYSVQYGTKTLSVAAVGGQSGCAVTYEIISGDAGTVVSIDNKGEITFISGKNGIITVKAILDGGDNYNDITAEVNVEVKTNDFSSKYIVEPTVPSSCWYTDNVSIKPLDGYKISNSGQFDTDWKDEIVIATEGKNIPDTIYLKEVATGYISEAVTVVDIYIDKTAPTALEISYSKSIRDIVLETVSFGFYKAEMTVTLQATDNISKIDHLIYQIGENGEEITINKENLTFTGENGETATSSFKISPDLSRSKITLTAFDVSGRAATITGDKTLVVDKTAPVISVSYDNNSASHGTYFKANRIATISIKEENFFKDNLYDEVYINDENGNPIAQGYNYLTITVGKRSGNEEIFTLTNVEPVFEKDGDVYKATVEFLEDADYTFDVDFYDYSTNKNTSVNYGESVAPAAFTIDKTDPILKISYKDDESTESEINSRYYQGKRKAVFEVTEHNFNPEELMFTEFSAKDVQGNIVLKDEINAYVDKLHNIANWSRIGDVFKAEILVDADANYNVILNYNDLANNTAKQETSVFCLDNTKPYVVESAEIAYSASIFDTILNTITFGFYNADVTATITAYDETAGVDYFTYSYTVDYSNDKEGHKDEVGNANDSGQKDIVIPNEEITFDKKGKKATASFSIPVQFRGYVSFTATDKSGNESELFKDTKCIVVDNVAPGVNVTYDNNNVQNGKYYKADRTATISISADNFFKDYLYCPIDGKEGNENYLVIKVGKRLDNQTNYSYSYEQPAFTKDGDVYKATVKFDENADYTFDIKYTDKSHNVYDSYKTDEFTIDKKDPTVEVVFTEPAHSNGNQYRARREATIYIDERNFDAKDVAATVAVKNAQGTVFDYAAYLKDNKNWTSNGDVHTTTIEFDIEAHYTFDIKYTDLAGNVFDSYDKTNFTIDKTAPTGLDIKINNVSVAGSMNTSAFNKFYQSTVAVMLSANCDISGLESLKYQKIANISDYDVNGTWVDYNDSTGIVVSPSEKFVIYFRAEDRAGNVSIIRSTGIVVDNQNPIGEKNAPEIDILPATPNANGVHKGNVNVDLKVVDPKYSGAVASSDGHYSGLNKITYKIYTTDTKAIQNGTLFEIGKTNSGAVVDSDNLVNSWSGNITVDSAKFNSNNVIVEVTATDNAGNTRTSTTLAGDIKIDITAPTIDITYNNNNVDSNRYFKADRTATIVITERNFNAANVITTITSSNGNVPKLSSWKKSSGTGNMDDTTWTATVNYNSDGDYTFSIQYTDLAGNKCTSVNFGDSAVPRAFTIDKTMPTIKVSYDNNNALNTNYYNKERIATIEINEHNFSTDRVKIALTATDDGKAITAPAVKGWTSKGDVHTATIAYNADALYTFDIDYKDLAGNSSADFSPQTFYVDKTAPTLDFSGVKDQSANNGDVIPIVSYSDTNYDDSKVTITLTGANRKSVQLEGSYSNIHNGRVFTFKNFAKEKVIDDIYTLTATLTDKAGNVTTKTINFSVNRFGSTYQLSNTTSNLNGKYIKTPVDVVITETNANRLSNIKITIFKDGNPIILKENTDYRIDINGGNGQWYQYTYTIYAKNFADDAVYSVTVESDDAAGNDAKNDQDTKNTALSFGVDSTLPIVNIENLESKTTYAVETLTVKMSVKDNLKLVRVIVELDGEVYKVWADEELEQIIKNGGNFTFDIPGDSTSAHNLVIYAVDAAGNGEKISSAEFPANAEQVENFYVTTNLWVRYYTNTPLFLGSIAGVILVAGLIIFIILKKKKKNEEK